jgi:hypothetical protein
MASTIKNVAGAVTKLTRGFPASLGTIVSANDVVAFTVPEPTRDNQGVLCIQVQGGTTPTCLLNASIDGGTSWFVVPLPTVITTASFGDTATTATFYPITISGLGSGAQFRFGRSDGNGGNAKVFALVG